MFDASRGLCSLCGTALGEPRDPDWRRGRWLWIPTQDFHLDHIRPLCEWPQVEAPTSPDQYPQVYAAWLPDNLQVLCEDCHKAKTAQEATGRATARHKQARTGWERLPLGVGA